MPKTAWLILTALIFWSLPAYGETLPLPEPDRIPSLISVLRMHRSADFCGEPLPMEIPEVRENFEKEMMLTLWNRAQTILWLKRTARYFPHIETILKERNLPDDLKYIAVAESALMPEVVSSQGAVGLWQFISATAKRYGLTVDRNIDERRNTRIATRAALDYLSGLNQMLGSWTLAAAAYNMGEDGLQGEMLAQGETDYYRLRLPQETQRYVFRIVAIKLIIADPARYGFDLGSEDLYPPEVCESVELQCSRSIPVYLIARAAGTYFKNIRNLNPQIMGHYLDAGRYRLCVPQARGFEERFRNLLAEWLAARENSVYVVKKGDNLSLIAERFNVPLKALLIWNGISPRSPIHPGDRLIVRPVTP